MSSFRIYDKARYLTIYYSFGLGIKIMLFSTVNVQPKKLQEFNEYQHIVS